MITGVAPEILETVDLFAALEEAQRQRLLDECEWVLVQAGALIARAGEEWSALFLVVSGQVRLVDERVKPVAVTIDVLSPGSAFGESTLFDKSSGFSAYCQTDAVLLKLDRDALKRAVASDPALGRALQDYQRQRAVRTFLRASTVFGTLAPRQLQFLVQSLEKRPIAGGEVVIHQGDDPDGLFIVEKGRLRVYREENPSQTLASLESGAVVGEIACLSGKPRNASAAAETITTVWFLPKEAFDVLLGQNVELASSFKALSRERRMGSADATMWIDPRAKKSRRPTAAARAADTPESAAVSGKKPALLRVPASLLVEIGIASLLAQSLYLLLPVFARFVLDDVIAMRDDRWIGPVAAGLAAAAVLSLVAALCRSYLLRYSARVAEENLLRTLWRHTLRLPLPFFDRRAPDEAASRLGDAGVLARYYTQTAMGFAVEGIVAILYLALMVHYSRQLGVVTLLLALANGAVLWLGTWLESASRGGIDWQQRRDAHLVELLARLRTIRLLGAEVFVRWEFETLLVRAANSARRTLNRELAAETVSRFFSMAGATVILFYGAWLVLQGHLTAGQLVACMMLAPGLTAPLRGAARFDEARREAQRSSERLAEVLKESPEPQAEVTPARPLELRSAEKAGVIRFENVWFRYQNDGRDILQGFDCEIQAGQRTVILGRSGCGKSTVVKLLMGFYEPVSGRITLDGLDLRNMSRAALRKRMGVVLQQSFLFRDTVRGNIARGAPEAAYNDVVIAAQRAGAHDFISALPRGYETFLDGQGAGLSGGQKQRIMIAQALLRDPEVLVFDEATSALDQEADRFFLYNLDTAYQGRTTLLIAPRQRTIKTAAQILVLEDGRVAAQGTYKELSTGFYRSMIAQQE